MIQMKENKIKEIAEDYKKNGLCPIAFHNNTKVPKGKGWENQTRNNCMKGFDNPDSNIGLLTGEEGDLTCWDIDIYHKIGGEYVSCEEAIEFHKLTKEKYDKHLKETPHSTTLSGGDHYAWKYTDKLKSGNLKFKGVGVGEIINSTAIGCYPTKAYSKKSKKMSQYKPFNSSLDKRKPMPDELIEWFNEHLGVKKNNSKVGNSSSVVINNTQKNKSKIKDEDEIKQLLGCLSPDEDYNEWISIGIDLHGISDNCFYLWNEWSKKGSKYTNENDLYKKWIGFKSSGTGIGGLHKKAKEENPEEYRKIIKDNIYKFVLQNHTREDTGLVDIFNKKWGKYVNVVGVKNIEVYMYDSVSGLWVVKPSFCLKNLFTRRLEELFTEILKWVRIKLNTIDEGEKERFIKYEKSLYKTLKKIQKGGGKDVLKLLLASNHDIDFVKKLNKLPHMLSVKNGLIDLKTGEIRDRRMDDYISYSTESEYDTSLKTGAVEKWIGDMMLDDKTLIDYLQKLLGYGITGEVSEQILPIFIGTGGNGKGVLLRALQRVLEKQYTNVQQSVLMKTERGSAGGASPHLACLVNTRLAVLTESDANEQLSEGLVKQLTGGDSFSCRKLYSDIIEVEPQFLPIIQTNNAPEFGRMDDGLRRRVVVVSFLTEYKDKRFLDDKNPNHRLGDLDIDNKIKKLTNNFLLWLVQGAKKWYDTKDLKSKMPESVAKYTVNYLDNQDVVKQFIDSCITEKDGIPFPRMKLEGKSDEDNSPNPYTIKTALFDAFIDSNDSGKKVSKRDFYNMLKKRGFDIEKKKSIKNKYTGKYQATRIVYGIKLPDNDNDIDTPCFID